jgi:glutamate dehydrogenase
LTTTVTPEVLDRLLDKAADVGADPRSTGLPGDVRHFLRQYYRYVSPQDVLQRDPVDVFGAALSHYRLAQQRPQGRPLVRVSTPTVEENGWQCGHTVVEVVTDDMPFLVDSITAELSRQDRGIHLVVHPLFDVRRTVTGELVDLRLDPDGSDTATGALAPDDNATGALALRESWIHVEIDRESASADLAAIESGLLRVLSDVREAVEDWPKMTGVAQQIADALRTTPPPLPQVEVDEAEELLVWLADDHFTFLGYREYRLVDHDGADALVPVAGSGLGILRSDEKASGSFAVLPPRVRARARDPKLLVLTKANSRSTVHRPSYLDYIGVKVFDGGVVVGERRFLGLLTSVAYTESVERIPVLRRKTAEVLALSGLAPESHSGRALLDVLQTYPRDELFGVGVDELLPTVLSVMNLQERRQLRMFLRTDPYGRYVSVLVYLPRDRFTTSVRLHIQDILMHAFGGRSLDFSLRHSESVLSRIHFVVRLPVGADVPDVDVAMLEAELAAASTSWGDDFSHALTEQVGEEDGARWARRYGDAFGEAYKADFTPRHAVSDLRVLEGLPDTGGLAVSLYEPVGASSTDRRLKLYRTGTPLSLSALLPVLSRMGLEVTDERPYPIRTPDHRSATIYDLGVQADLGTSTADHKVASSTVIESVRALFSDAFVAIWDGRAESDGFNALVLRAGMTWREAMVFRTYARYLRQTGTTFSHEYLALTICANLPVARLLLSLFNARLDPARADGRDAAVERISTDIETALEGVTSLDEDRILRSYITLIRTTLRTNYFQPGDDGELRDYVSIKFDSQRNPDLPQPRPHAEIWVYSPRVEGVHLRFGAVARGGLRWSDRREDFRTEVLGLVKAQTVKNAVIVPSGAKGGFFAKQLPDPGQNREAWLAEGIACFTIFIAGLLDLTDNLVNDVVVAPHHVVRYDGDDPYLVVAADKGTATFSDIANSVAADYRYWLGDGFASGGSAGYDHKVMGITARGAWKSVERHFRELGIDTAATDFTCVGVGDMSGDVFGNGLLASAHTRLVAAFDHRHVFVDPDPDAAASYVERRRLFELPRSSWDDYDRSLISTGGGVWPRSAKSIALTPQLRAALGIAEDVSRLTPAALIKVVLMAPVDLFFNGGIGTYVKASTESHAQVGDRANDAVRIDGGQLRARCVGEGGNLGLTQLGRVEYSRSGGRITTDFIDNSAGVDTSDHEVNIKILLDRVVGAGDLTVKQRNVFLASMTAEVADLVLAHNIAQNVGLANAVAQASDLLHVHAGWIRRLEDAGLLDRELEFLPSDADLTDLKATGDGLSQPDLCVLMAYTKIALTHELVDSDLPEDPYLHSELRRYFPTPMRERFADQMNAHRLRREIVATRVVGDLVDIGGITMFHRLSQETGSTAADVARAHVTARAIFGTDELWREITALDNVVSAAAQTRARLASRLIAERSCRWLLNNRRPPLSIVDTVEFFRPRMQRLFEVLPGILMGRAAGAFAEERDSYIADGLPESLATRIAVLSPAYAGFGIIETADRRNVDLASVARLHAELGERLQLDKLLTRILDLPRDDQWRTMARAALRDDLQTVHVRLLDQVVGFGEPTSDPEELLAAWEAEERPVITRVTGTLGQLVDASDTDLARLQVALRLVRTLVGTTG